ncbi:MAG TPA: DUF4389 domain-containing protein [Solirubrobacterales bacterium]|jgi:hypothetical protein
MNDEGTETPPPGEGARPGEGTPPPPAPPPPAEAPGAGEQVRIVINDDLERSRLTVGFRLILVIPHLLFLYVWGLLAAVMAVINWFAIVFSGRTVGGDLQTRFLRYFTHVDAYLYLAANPYPPFGGGEDYPIDLIAVEQREQSRLKTFFRAVLAVPALLLGAAFGASGIYGGSGHFRTSFGLLGAAAFLGWFVSVFRARMPRGLRDLSAYALWYSAQAAAYLLLVTERYPNSDPLVPDYGSPPPEHPIRISCDDDLRRSRLTVFFRLLLWLPHLVWLVLWGIVTVFAIVANWFVTLFSGTPADPLHRFISAYLRYETHNFAFIGLVANPFPGFTGREGSYPIDLSIAPPARQNRWKTGFRIILGIPALLLSSALQNAAALVALFGWFTGLFLGHMPQGLRNLGVFALRYSAQLNGYLWLLTDTYPFSGPSQESLAEPTAIPETA